MNPAMKKGLTSRRTTTKKHEPEAAAKWLTPMTTKYCFQILSRGMCSCSATAVATRLELIRKYTAVRPAIATIICNSGEANALLGSPLRPIAPNAWAAAQIEIDDVAVLKSSWSMALRRRHDTMRLSIAIVTVAAAGPKSTAHVMKNVSASDR